MDDFDWEMLLSQKEMRARGRYRTAERVAIDQGVLAADPRSGSYHNSVRVGGELRDG